MPTIRIATLVVKVKFLVLFLSFSQRYSAKKTIIGTVSPNKIYFIIQIFYLICLTSKMS